MKYDFNSLAEKFSRRFLKTGDVLFREGDTNGDGFIIETGELELTKRHQEIVERAAVLNEGEVVGVWKTLFNNDTRFFTATANQDTSVIVIPEAHLKFLIDKADPFLLHCFRKWIDVSRSHIIEKSSGS